LGGGGKKNGEFKASQGYEARLCPNIQKKKELDLLVMPCSKMLPINNII
jgi:hypothetical protein